MAARFNARLVPGVADALDNVDERSNPGNRVLVELRRSGGNRSLDQQLG